MQLKAGICLSVSFIVLLFSDLWSGVKDKDISNKYPQKRSIKKIAVTFVRKYSLILNAHTFYCHWWCHYAPVGYYL